MHALARFRAGVGRQQKDFLAAGAAGGDPWHVNKTIQSGSPGEISELATAFYEAGVCTQETSEEFNVAKQRFESAWDRQDGGDHPTSETHGVTLGERVYAPARKESVR